MDITYIPMAHGFVYLAAVLDWFSRRVLSWRVSITMEGDFCLDTVEEALARHGGPEIFNTDQGSQLGFNRSSQQPCEPIAGARQTPRQASSSQGSCEA
jgi:putative transposase